MPKCNRYMKLLVMAFVSTSSFAMVFDNRFLPLFQHPWLGIGGMQSNFWMNGMIATASSAINDQQATIGIPELFGQFDQQQYGNAFVCAGRPNPLRSDWQGPEKIEWKQNGKIQMQGFALGWQQLIIPYLSIGGTWAFMHVNTREEFKLGTTNLFLGPGDHLQLDQIRRSMFSSVGINAGESTQNGSSDIDAYLRVGNTWDYQYKMKQIDVGLNLGLLVPTGVKHDINKPSSIPFGGNGHWGFYAAIDALFELKDDLKFGFLARVSKRLPRTSCQRMPVNNEPYILGVETGLARVNPGVTGVFAPYIVLENLRKGFGASVQYLLTAHGEDEWRDERPDKSVPVRLGLVEENSAWASDYASVNIFYNFGEVKTFKRFDPVLSLRWDIPAVLFVAKNMIRTHKISFGIEFAY